MDWISSSSSSSSVIVAVVIIVVVIAAVVVVVVAVVKVVVEAVEKQPANIMNLHGVMCTTVRVSKLQIIQDSLRHCNRCPKQLRQQQHLTEDRTYIKLLFIYFTADSVVSWLVMTGCGPIRLQSRSLLRFKLVILAMLHSFITLRKKTFTILFYVLTMVDTGYFRFFYSLCLLTPVSSDDIRAYRRDLSEGPSIYIIF